ncbi:MAG: type 3 dihydrofolate reductase [Vibrio sp.]
MKISMIAAMAHNRVIGIENQMPWHLPADFAWFKQQTMGKPVVMGRKTYESIGRPLPGRLNIVISRNPDLAIEGVTCVTSLEQAFTAAADCDELMVIGGGSIYQAFLEKAHRLYLTYVDAKLDGDTQFPDWGENWQQVESIERARDEKNQYDMRFVILERV